MGRHRRDRWKPQSVLFTRDLRVRENPALASARALVPGRWCRCFSLWAPRWPCRSNRARFLAELCFSPCYGKGLRQRGDRTLRIRRRAGRRGGNRVAVKPGRGARVRPLSARRSSGTPRMRQPSLALQWAEGHRLALEATPGHAVASRWPTSEPACGGQHLTLDPHALLARLDAAALREPCQVPLGLSSVLPPAS